MSISKEQYEAAKKIVQEYEQSERFQDYMDAEEDEDDYDERDWEEEEQERQEEEDFERAASCTCGAWVIGNDGRGHHVADCYCGAE